MNKNILRLVSLTIILIPWEMALGYGHANRWGGSSAHTYGASSHTNAYGGSTTHSYGEGTSHTSAYGTRHLAQRLRWHNTHQCLWWYDHRRGRGMAQFILRPMERQPTPPRIIRPLPTMDTIRPRLWATTERDATTAPPVPLRVPAAVGAMVGVAAGAAIASSNSNAATSNAYAQGYNAGAANTTRRKH